MKGWITLTIFLIFLTPALADGLKFDAVYLGKEFALVNLNEHPWTNVVLSAGFFEGSTCAFTHHARRRMIKPKEILILPADNFQSKTRTPFSPQNKPDFPITLRITGNLSSGRAIGEKKFIMMEDIRAFDPQPATAIQQPSPPPVVRSQQKPTPPPAPIKKKPARWREVAAWSGSDNKNTETFTVNSHEWRIRWDSKPNKSVGGNFSVFLYTEKGKMKSLVVNASGASSDSSIMRGKGSYYLDISSLFSDYAIIVEENY